MAVFVNMRLYNRISALGFAIVSLAFVGSLVSTLCAASISEKEGYSPFPFWGEREVEGQYTRAFFPFYRHSIQNEREDKWYLGPFVHEAKWTYGAHWIERTRILGPLLVSESARSNEGFKQDYYHIWPFFVSMKSSDGASRTEILTPLSLFRPSSSREVIKLDREPIALYRQYKDPVEGRRISSLLGVLRSESGPSRNVVEIRPILSIGNESRQHPHIRILGGLLGVDHDANSNDFNIQLFWLNFGTSKTRQSERQYVLNTVERR